ncbi:hypothetical protein SDRG_04481 [Saprolegnia diclina VS20]|uniref:Uncharacterized protein n=1 Tax=Saprolegnia diclina (strain VS20) TaxID=1156394 RepID=T0QTM3_SAPDV|nr:hypothetical protein SDRG_04481 [Saprolegnia diclina VS20]EQC38051.1 hypothetical protein SDRG_04481 [Saprolegnia diclina VS20]|eukprot:XP_008608378.1 hypothetical protein SDRG_04481 [Saprolegnia diclina VS20]
MVVRIKVRVFLFPVDPLVEHSYVVGSRPGGLSSVIGMVVVEDDEDLTFQSVRPRIELQQDGSVLRRHIMYQEALFLMTSGANPHQWPVKALQTYWLGYYAHEDDLVPTIIPTADEHQSFREFLDMKTTKLTADLILIPQSQIGPVCNACCQGCAACPPIAAWHPRSDVAKVPATPAPNASAPAAAL